MASNDRRSGNMDASEAARILEDPNATEEERSIAGSVLAQSNTNDVTSARVASEAGQVMNDPNATAEERSVAASDLSQRSKPENG